MEPIRINSLDPKFKTIPIEIGEGEVDHLVVKLQRPSRAGVARIATRLALGIRSDYGTGVVQNMDSRGLQMDAILREYCVELPDALAVLDDKGEQLKDENKRPIIDIEKIPPELYAAIGEVAVEWHETFRSVDVRFSADGSEKP